VLSRAGDASRSQKLMEELVRQSPTDTLLNSVWLPVVRAANQIEAKQPAQAVASLEITIPYEMGSPPDGATYWPMFLRGEAYLHLGDGPKAATEYRKILDHRGIAPTSPLYTLAIYLGDSGIGASLRFTRGQSESKNRLSGFLRSLEGRRPRCPFSERRQSRVRQALDLGLSM
jgi:eukaryotic-like serine/threonine-protein kinase